MKKVKSISFNDSNPIENEMLKFIGRRNFSSYVKKMIKEDMKRQDKHIIKIDLTQS